MRILLSAPNDGQTNNYLINALQTMGHEVFFIDHRANFQNAVESLPEFIKMIMPDMFLCLYLVPGKTYPADYIKMLKGKFPNLKYASWIFDVTMNLMPCNENKEFVAIIKEYDYFFTTVDGQVESFREQGVNAYHLHEGCDPFTIAFLKDYPQDIDVSFIGQLGHPQVHQYRIPILKEVVRNFTNTRLYGPVYQMDEDLMRCHVGRPTFNDVEHSRVVARSKVNLGLSGWPEAKGGFSARNYRILAASGFLLANRGNHIEDYFIENEEIVLFDDKKDCIEKIKYYLKHDVERLEIAQKGRERVLRDYTFVQSFARMFKIISETDSE
jgi:spore maturation protein CgeB